MFLALRQYQFLVIFNIWAKVYIWNNTEQVLSLRFYFLEARSF